MGSTDRLPIPARREGLHCGSLDPIAPSKSQSSHEPRLVRGLSRIETLPGDTVSKLRSTVQINSLQDVVVGLLKNALDAGASTISISVRLDRGHCVVEDDGSGIHPGDLQADSAFGEPFREEC